MPDMDLDFTEAELHRYSRHILLQDVGAVGQAKLRAARVLIVGAGGLGAPLALYLAAAGVGTIGLVDHDALELSNLQRQVIHATARIGRNKAESAAETLAGLNPEVTVDIHPVRMDAATARDLIPRYDLVCDGTDISPPASCSAMPATCSAGRWSPPPCCASRASSPPTSRISARRIPATAACTPSRRPMAWCRPAPRPGCSAPSPA